MKLISIKRETKPEVRFTKEMGALSIKVTYIKKQFMNIPYKTLHEYRETYYGEVKDCKQISLAK